MERQGSNPPSAVVDVPQEVPREGSSTQEATAPQHSEVKYPGLPCVYGCSNERLAKEICCKDCWAKIPRFLKRELWDATKELMYHRGRRKNGTQTPRLKHALASIVKHLVVTVSAPYEQERQQKQKNELSAPAEQAKP